MKIQLTLLVLAGSGLWAQSASPKWQEFSIGPPTRMQAGWPPNGVRAEGVPLKRALARAYGVPENRILGPEWLADTRYAITGIVADPKDFKPLFQQELTTQFHMLAHREAKVVPVYVLKPLGVPAKLVTSSGPGTATTSGGTDGRNSMRLPRSTVGAFADMLGDNVGRPIIDETHMDGTFEFVLNWKAGSTTALQAAVREQLGLELTDERRSVDVVVIDHIEKLQLSK